MQAQGGPGGRRDGGGSLWLAELVPAGLAWQLLSEPGTLTAWHCGAVFSGPTSRPLGRRPTKHKLFYHGRLCLPTILALLVMAISLD